MFPFQDHRRLRAVATPLRAEVSTGITAKHLFHVLEAACFLEQTYSCLLIVAES